VLEEMGRACFLSPFFTTVVLGAGTIMEAGDEEQQKRHLPGIAAGEKIVTLALAEDGGDLTPGSIHMKAERSGDGFLLNGRKLFVPDVQSANLVICAAQTGHEEEDITLFIVDIKHTGINVQALKTISGEKLSIIEFNDTAVGQDGVLGEVGKGWPVVNRVIERVAIARCAEMVGICRQVLKLTLDYAKERLAFGHPIGAFQAIQHRCAAMLADTEGAGFTTYRAAWRLSEGLPAAREVAAARAWVGPACRRVCASAHQVHGAIGFTQDHILHFYTKKANACEAAFGGSEYYLEKLFETQTIDT